MQSVPATAKREEENAPLGRAINPALHLPPQREQMPAHPTGTLTYSLRPITACLSQVRGQETQNTSKAGAIYPGNHTSSQEPGHRVHRPGVIPIRVKRPRNKYSTLSATLFSRPLTPSVPTCHSSKDRGQLRSAFPRANANENAAKSSTSPLLGCPYALTGL